MQHTTHFQEKNQRSFRKIENEKRQIHETKDNRKTKQKNLMKQMKKKLFNEKTNKRHN